jgi:hypothetical protein
VPWLAFASESCTFRDGFGGHTRHAQRPFTRRQWCQSNTGSYHKQIGMVQAIGINRQGNRAKAGKAFFFEKKKQKTLDPSVSLPI